MNAHPLAKIFLAFVVGSGAGIIYQIWAPMKGYSTQWAIPIALGVFILICWILDVGRDLRNV